MFKVNTRFWKERAGCWSRRMGPKVSLLGNGSFLQSQAGRYTLLNDEDDEDNVDFSSELDLLNKMGR